MIPLKSRKSQSPFSSGEVFHGVVKEIADGDFMAHIMSQSPFSSGEVFHTLSFGIELRRAHNLLRLNPLLVAGKYSTN